MNRCESTKGGVGGGWSEEGWKKLSNGPVTKTLGLSDLKTQSVPRSKHSLPWL